MRKCVSSFKWVRGPCTDGVDLSAGARHCLGVMAPPRDRAALASLCLFDNPTVPRSMEHTKPMS
jgi:hypothetical protein